MQNWPVSSVSTSLVPVCDNELNKRCGISFIYGKVMSLKTPICSFYTNTGVLCAKCE